MKKEPLKGKRIPLTDLRNYNDGFGFYCADIKSAVGWLKEEDKIILKEISELLKDINPGLFTKVIAKVMKMDLNKNKAFEDVMKK